VGIKVKHSIIFFFISCMVCLTMQSTLLSLNKAGKFYKSQSSLNSNPISEEEETHKEKESDSDVILYHQMQAAFLLPTLLEPTMWPCSNTNCQTPIADISVPPPEVS